MICDEGGSAQRSEGVESEQENPMARSMDRERCLRGLYGLHETNNERLRRRKGIRPTPNAGDELEAAVERCAVAALCNSRKAKAGPSSHVAFVSQLFESPRPSFLSSSAHRRRLGCKTNPWLFVSN